MIKILYDVLRQHILHFSQIRRMARMDLIKTYGGSVLSWLWAILKPAIMIFTYWFTLTIGLRVGRPVEGYPFFLWFIAGIIPWFYISDVMRHGMESMRKYSYLITKLKFPLSTIPTFVNISRIYIHTILLIILISIFWAAGYPMDIYFAQLPLYIFFMFVFFAIWSLLTSCLAVLSRDFANLVKSIITPLFWFSGILYDPNTVTIEWVKKLLMLNPITFVTNGFRNVFVYKIYFFEQPKRLIYFIIITIAMLIAALWVYKKTHKEIPDAL